MLPALIPIIGPVIDKLVGLIPDQQEREKAKQEAEIELARLDQETLKVLLNVDSKQIDVNIEEAKSSKLFVSGWRPFLGWVCGAAFAWTYVGQPVIAFCFNAAGHPLTLPTIEFGEMSSILMGMLGLSGMRTFEKYKKVASK
jgi:hypothetical protein